MLFNSRNRYFAMVFDLCMLVVAWCGASWLRSSPTTVPWQALFAWKPLLILLLVQGCSFYGFGLYRGVWRFASVPDLIRIVKAVVVGVLVSAACLFLFNRLAGIPRSAFVLYGILLIMLLGGARLLYRWSKDQGIFNEAANRLLIVGAGRAGEAFVRDILRDRNSHRVMAFVDDDKRKHGQEIHGVRVRGAFKDIPKLAEKLSIDTIVIAIPSATSQQMRAIVTLCEETRAKFITMPSINDIAFGRVNINTLREVSIEDLLGREPVRLDWQLIRQGLVHKRVLVSGGGGSIGSELVRQLVSLSPQSLIVLENSEYNLYKINHEIQREYPTVNLCAHLIDVTDRRAVQEIFAHYQPELVFHAAAYKHVPLLEQQIKAAVHNNIVGTTVMAEEAIRANVEKFILISTDKAVNPTNVMGASKRAAEIFCQTVSRTTQNTKFIITRFGNVLGSRGSVVPLFKEQLQAGGPLTVTHPDITRYFMTISEACQLILQTAAFGHGGEIFVLDMGEPIKIQYLAEQLIQLSGKKVGEDIQITYTGLRPGEKLHEELFYQHEMLQDTSHPKIHRAECKEIEHLEANRYLQALITGVVELPEEKLYELLHDLVAKFSDTEQKQQPADITLNVEQACS